MPIGSSFKALIGVKWFALCLLFSNFGEPDVQVPPNSKEALFKHYYGNDYKWYMNNVPFFECSDTNIQNVYYYRWKLFKAHIREVGPEEYVITEFINHVPWDREPFCTINAASMHHIYEGRWLRDDRYINGYIKNLVLDGGNNRKYSESVADAAYARYLVNADKAFLLTLLDSMKATFEGWYDHYDSAKQMYYIPAMPDATEYTIASIDASGGKDGFEGGEAFRPTINSYMYGNAVAIAKAAALKGDKATKDLYTNRASLLKKLVEQNLWSDSLQHFIDRYKVSNQYVRYWDFIRGRELAGMAPWYFNLPSDTKKYAAAWKHVSDTNYLLGAHGFRTNEPSYEYYFKQFVFFEGKPGSQWNGPSWPYQSSQALTSMANLLNNYHQDVVTKSDYVRLLRLYTKQHILPNGEINLVENYDPNNGGPIVYYYWSNHYLHSTYNNLVISGLCGVRPAEGDSLSVYPLIDSTIDFFKLDDINYHGHRITVEYDRDGSKYRRKKGVNVFVDDEEAKITNGKVHIGRTGLPEGIVYGTENLALNIRKSGYPKPTASVNASPDTSMFQAIDGRIWYFPEIINYWSTRGSDKTVDWYGLDFGKVRKVETVKLHLFADEKEFSVPDSVVIQYKAASNDTNFITVKLNRTPQSFLSNTENVISFEPVNTTQLRIVFHHKKKEVAVTEIVVN